MADEDTLDLSGATADATEQEPAKRGPGRPPGSKNKSTADAAERKIKTRIEQAFNRIGNMLKRRGDDELGDAIVEEKSPMAEGLVNLTDRVPKLRPPLLVGLDTLETMLGFGRVGGILFRRARDKRMEAMELADQLAAEDLAAYEAEMAGENGQYANAAVQQ